MNTESEVWTSAVLLGIGLVSLTLAEIARTFSRTAYVWRAKWVKDRTRRKLWAEEEVIRQQERDGIISPNPVPDSWKTLK